MILGIDEAGRGPVIGPLVLAGVWADAEQIQALHAMGVRDSKAYGSTQAARAARAIAAERIREVARVAMVVAPAEQVDRWTRRHGLNRLEQCMAQRLIAGGPSTSSIVADGRRLFGPLQQRYPQLVALDRADEHHPLVAAASIMAKHERDRALGELLAAEELGPMHTPGGGYPNAATERLLRGFVARHGRLPRGVRRSWSWPVLQELVGAIATGKLMRSPSSGPG